MIYCLDRYGVVLGALDNSAPQACPFWNDSHVETLDGELSYDFECPGDHEVSQFIQPENQVLWRDHDGSNRLARIKVVDEQSEADGSHIKVVHAEGTHGDLNGLIVRPMTFAGEPIADAIATLVAASDWDVGEIEFDGIIDLELNDYPTVLSAVREVISMSGLEWRFRVEFDGNRVTGRYIDGVSQLGRVTGKRFAYSHDIKGLRRTLDSSERITAAIGVGAAKSDGNVTTFADVVWEAPDDPVDKTIGQDWVGIETDGPHVFGVFEDADETSPTKLLDKTWLWLQSRIETAVSYEIDAALLDVIEGHEHDRVALGDTVVVVDKRFTPPVESIVRVNEVRRSYSDPTGTGFAVQRGVLR